jgi:hypothetical protein
VNTRDIGTPLADEEVNGITREWLVALMKGRGKKTGKIGRNQGG